MYYTSYFANIKKLPPDVVPIAIFPFPVDYTGLQYRKLAPTLATWHWWKNKHHDNNIYAKEYKHLILDRLDPLLVEDELLAITNGRTFCFVSDVKSDEFNLLPLISDWLKKAGIDIQEFNPK